ncbi:aminoglycoside acetyltransferase [Klebsiella pneumoniae]|nr:aminoglycoside acetyltransferase [Klebsiella pneumoniae]
MHTRKAITEALQKLGVQTGDLLMVHASLKAIGPVEGGAETVVAALRSALLQIVGGDKLIIPFC